MNIVRSPGLSADEVSRLLATSEEEHHPRDVRVTGESLTRNRCRRRGQPAGTCCLPRNATPGQEVYRLQWSEVDFTVEQQRSLWRTEMRNSIQPKSCYAVAKCDRLGLRKNLTGCAKSSRERAWSGS